MHGEKLANNMGGGGVQNTPWVLGTLIYEGLKLRKRGKTGFFHLFSVFTSPKYHCENISILLFAPLQLSHNKRLLGRNSIVGTFTPITPPPPQLTPMSARV